MMDYCILIPTYNNARTLLDVVERSLQVCPNVVVVNDGSTDNTADLLRQVQDRVEVVSYMPNRGKGHALKCGLAHARKLGYRYAVTLDSDGQHQPEEVPCLVREAQQHSDEKVLVVGARNLTADGMPSGNTFANKFSNFWFKVQTGHSLPDTQTGFRLYQLDAMPHLNLITNRYESELELLVFAAWRGVTLLSVPITVSYPEDRVSHFRPFADFMRITLLNTGLCLLAVVFGYPSMWVHRICRKRPRH